MRHYRGYLFDLDGTLYRGEEALPYAADVLFELRQRGAAVGFLTNNSTQTGSYFAAKLARMGFEAYDREVVSSGIGTAVYCQQQGVQTAFVVGESGLVETLRNVGVEVVNAGMEGHTVATAPDGDVDAVVVGLCRHFDYPMMNAAMQRIRAGAKFIATNPDTTYPMEGGRLIPGAGSVLAGVRACSEVEPFIVGKPNRFLVDLALDQMGLTSQETLVVGDRIDTDIHSGEAAGCDTFLVLTGISSDCPEGQWGGPDLRGLLDPR